MPRVKPSLPSRLLDAAALADLLCVKQSWIYDQVQKREIPYLRINNRFVRFDPDEIAKWISTQRVEPW